jgi:uncharacterized protein (DUF305 family)
MSLMKKIVLALMAAALLATFALETVVRAQTDHSGHGTGAMSSTEAADAPASQAYKAAMDKMHSAMSAQKYTGNADVDFAVGMIPHHQAAIDMAKTVLEHGKDPEIRKLAEDIVAAQEREIKQLEDWLKKNPAN